MLTIRQAAARADVRPPTVHAWIARGLARGISIVKLPAVRNGGRWSLDPATFDAYRRGDPPFNGSGSSGEPTAAANNARVAAALAELKRMGVG